MNEAEASQLAFLKALGSRCPGAILAGVIAAFGDNAAVLDPLFVPLLLPSIPC